MCWNPSVQQLFYHLLQVFSHNSHLPIPQYRGAHKISGLWYRCVTYTCPGLDYNLVELTLWNFDRNVGHLWPRSNMRCGVGQHWTVILGPFIIILYLIVVSEFAWWAWVTNIEDLATGFWKLSMVWFKSSLGHFRIYAKVHKWSTL